MSPQTPPASRIDDSQLPAYLEAEAAIARCQAAFETLLDELLLVDSVLANWAPQGQSIKSVVDGFTKNVFVRLGLSEPCHLPGLAAHLAWKHALSQFQQAHRALMQEAFQEAVQFRAAADHHDPQGAGARGLDLLYHRQYDVIRRFVGTHMVMHRFANLD